MDVNNVRGNLRGEPSRWAFASTGKRRTYEGFIKLRLGHSEGRSYLVPDVVIAVTGCRFFLPTFFGPPILEFNIEPGRHRARFNIDVGSPRASGRERLVIDIRSQDRIYSYYDGAKLYKCEIDGPPGLASFASGTCKQDGYDFRLYLFHHTTPANAKSISMSGELWSSAWNLAGTRRLANVAYAYFTTLSKIKDERDLQTIAMSSVGKIRFQTTSERLREQVLTLNVYRDSSKGRTQAMPFQVLLGDIAPFHIYLHRMVQSEPAYFEVVCPDILRVGVIPGARLQLRGSKVEVTNDQRKTFDHVVIGDASIVEGLAAPFNEEDTKQITHVERLDAETDLFEFWLSHQNSDQVSGRSVEPRRLEPLLAAGGSSTPG
jgi:hypothetical protein